MNTSSSAAPTAPPATPPDPGFDAGRLDAFLKARVDGCEGPLSLERIGGGQSNPTFFVTYPGRRLVLRKKPAGEVLPSAHAVDREYRVMAALGQTDVPVPRLVLFHAEPDVVGTPFYLMERLEGRVFHDAALPGVRPADRRAMVLSMAETLARLHRVDWRAVGLADYGRPEGYFARQIARWSKQWALSRTRDIPEIDALIAWLPAHSPEDRVAAICHGDYRMGNLMFHPAEPRVIAVLDWELSTLGNPLADAAFSALAWQSRPEWYGGLMGLDLEALGIPPMEEYLEAYYREAGSAERVEPFHLVFSLFRFAVILEGIAARARAGNAAGENAGAVGELSVAFARRAVEIARREP